MVALQSMLASISIDLASLMLQIMKQACVGRVDKSVRQYRKGIDTRKGDIRTILVCVRLRRREESQANELAG